MAEMNCTDMLGRTVTIPYPPRRIVSLVPSQTELLYDLGLEEEVVGITKFCVHPERWYRNKTRVGGTKQLHIDTITALQPDIIIANKEENTKEQIEELASRFPVWISNINNVSEVLYMIRAVGEICGKNTAAGNLASEISNEFTTFQSEIKNRTSAIKLPVAYLIWRNPWMSIGADTFIHSMIEAAGWTNIFSHEKRYPTISLQQLAACKPAMVFLSSEPYPFREKHIAEIQEMLPASKILLVDGEMFSWYGSRLKKAIPYLKQLQASI